jgi:transposase
MLFDSRLIHTWLSRTASVYENRGQDQLSVLSYADQEREIETYQDFRTVLQHHRFERRLESIRFIRLAEESARSSACG